MSRLRDTEDGTVVCMDCGHEALTDAGARAHWEETHAPKTALAEGAVNGLAGVAPSEVAASTVTDPVKSLLPPGAFRTSDHRYYFNGAGPVPSVTTILEVMSKPALSTWMARESVRAYLKHRTELDRLMWDKGEDAAINEAVKRKDESRDKAARIGTSVHLLADMASRGAESDPKGFQVSDEEIPYLQAWKAFCAFLEARGGRIVSSEHMVWSLNGYGGTYDLIVEGPRLNDKDDRQLTLIDIKTSKGYYPEYGLQLAAYRWADHIIVEGNPSPFPMPEIHRTAVLHLRPDQYKEGWKLIEYPTTYTQDYMTFLGCLEVYKWREEGRFLKSNLETVREA